MYSELVRNLEFLLKYSSKPCNASGLPLITALNSRSLSKRFGSFWLRDKCKVLANPAEWKCWRAGTRAGLQWDSAGKEGDRGEFDEEGGKKRKKKINTQVFYF